MVTPLRAGRHRFSVLNAAWFAMLAVAGALLLVPDLVAVPTRFGQLQSFPQDVLQNVYRLIRVAMPMLPAGMLLALALPTRTVRLVLLASVGAGSALALVVLNLSDAIALVRDLLFMVPGVACGMWLMAVSQSPGAAVASAAARADVPGVRLVSNAAHAGHGASSAGVAQGVSIGQLAPDAGAGSAARWAGRAIGGSLLVVAVVLAADLPRWGDRVALGLVAYAALVLWRPLLPLAIVPAALALLDLAPWTGRFFLNAFDLLMLTTLAVALWQGRLQRGAGDRGRLRGLLVVLLSLAGVSLLLGLLPLQDWDANAVSTYWSHYNSLRIAKGLLWGLLLYGLFQAWPVRSAAFSMLSVGMAAGVLGVGTWALWEHAQFAGTATTMDYRVTASFSSMHTGGGHFEAYLVMALPFVWGLALQGRHRMLRLVAVLIFVAGAYAMLTTVARGGAIALVIALLLLVTGSWRARARQAGAAGTRRGWLAVFLGVATLAAMLVGVSGTFWQQRLARTASDAQIRLQHWSDVLELRDHGWVTLLFGQGLGTLPASNLAHKLPDEAGSFRYGRDGDTPFLSLNSTGTLYMAQRVAPRPGEMLTLQLAVRVPNGKGGLQASLCEKNLFNSRTCRWLDIPVDAGSRAWQASRQTFNSGDIGAGNWLTRRPVQFSLYNPVAGTVVDVTGVRLRDASGSDLLHNGDFARGGDRWFFNSGDHLFWHAKNMWVHVLFEQGWLGLLALGVLVLLSTASLARPFVRGNLQATVWLAVLAGMLTTSAVESLLDAPRLALLAYFVLFAGASFVPEKATPVQRH